MREADRLFKSVKETRYQHEAFVDEKRGAYFLDCSSFLTLVLKKVAPDFLKAWSETLGLRASDHPLARDFVRYFSALGVESQPPWVRIEDARRIVAGDLIAWLVPLDDPSENVGHLMIATETPRKNPFHAQEVWLRVLDATQTAHGPNDTRTKKPQGGLGMGPISLLLDASGVAIAYRWSGPRGTILTRSTIRVARLAIPD